MAKQSNNVELKNIDGVPYVVRGKDVFILEVFTETDLNDAIRSKNYKKFQYKDLLI